MKQLATRTLRAYWDTVPLSTRWGVWWVLGTHTAVLVTVWATLQVVTWPWHGMVLAVGLAVSGIVTWRTARAATVDEWYAQLEVADTPGPEER